MRDFSVVQRMDLFVVRVALTLSGKAQLTQTLSQTHVCTRTYSRAETADRLQGQTGGSAASLTPLILFSTPHPIPVSLSLSERVTFLPSSFPPSLLFLSSISMCQWSRSLPPISLSFSPPFLFPSSSPGGSTSDLLPWPFAPTLLFPVTPAANLVCPQ